MTKLYECAFCHHIHEAKKGCVMVCCPNCLKAMDKKEREETIVRKALRESMGYCIE